MFSTLDIKNLNDFVCEANKDTKIRTKCRVEWEYHKSGTITVRFISIKSEKLYASVCMRLRDSFHGNKKDKRHFVEIRGNRKVCIRPYKWDNMYTHKIYKRYVGETKGRVYSSSTMNSMHWKKMIKV